MEERTKKSRQRRESGAQGSVVRFSVSLETGEGGTACGERDGGVAQLGEHLPCKQGVRGSNPLTSTRQRLEAVTRTEGRGSGKVQSPRAERGAKGGKTCAKRHLLYGRHTRPKRAETWKLVRGMLARTKNLYERKNVEVCTRHAREGERHLLYRRCTRPKRMGP